MELANSAGPLGEVAAGLKRAGLDLVEPHLFEAGGGGLNGLEQGV